MTSIADIVPPGVVTGDNLMKLLEHARDNAYALPAVNCTRWVESLSTVDVTLSLHVTSNTIESMEVETRNEDDQNGFQMMFQIEAEKGNSLC